MRRRDSHSTFSEAVIDNYFSFGKENDTRPSGSAGSTIQLNNSSHLIGDRFANHAIDLKGNNELLNLTQPDIIRAIHTAYLEAGARKGWGDTWEAVEPHVARDIPIGRIVTREEVAALVVFLASPVADGIHGQNIRVDGGGLDILT